MNNFTFNGSINLILGNMFSGKTSELLKRYRRYKISGKSCIVIKYKNDNRYDDQMVVTHDNIKIEALVCENLYEVNEKVKDYDVICIDEVQFYADANIFCDKWANQGKIIEASGLSGTFNRTPFPVVSLLIPLAESIIMLDAICVKTGQKASFTKLTVENNTGTEVIIGGSEKYLPVDRQTYFDGMNVGTYGNLMLRDFVKLYKNDSLEFVNKMHTRIVTDTFNDCP